MPLSCLVRVLNAAGALGLLGVSHDVGQEDAGRRRVECGGGGTREAARTACTACAAIVPFSPDCYSEALSSTEPT